MVKTDNASAGITVYRYTINFKDMVFDTVDKFIKENQIPIMKESVKKHKFASELLKEHKITAAWCVLLQK